MMRCTWLRLAACLLLAGIGAALAAPPVLGQPPPNRAGLVIRHGSGEVFTACVEFTEPEISGLQLLQRAGVDLNVDASSTGATVCRLRGEGCSVPQQACFCQCEGPTCTYWSYWRSGGGGWQYSNLGAGSSVVRPGEVDGWVWGPGSVESAGQPPALTFADVCAATSTPTPTPTSTSTATPAPAASATPTPVPTGTPTGTATAIPTPLPPSASGGPPVIELFAAERTQLGPGESTQLAWRVANASSVFLRAGSQSAPVDAAGTTAFAPPASVELWLEASNSSGTTRSAVRLEVIAPAVTAPPPTIPAPNGVLPTAVVLPTQAPAVPTLPPAPQAPTAEVTLIPVPTVPPQRAQSGVAAATAAQFRLALPVILAGAGVATPAEQTLTTVMPAAVTPVAGIANQTAVPTPSAAQTIAPLPVTLPSERQDLQGVSDGTPTPLAPGKVAAAAPVNLPWLILGILLLPLGAGVAGMLLWRLAKLVLAGSDGKR